MDNNFFVLILIIFVIVISLVLVLSTDVDAVSGYLEVEYHIGEGTARGIIDLNTRIDNLKLGLRGESDLAGFGQRAGLPTGIPKNQMYMGYAEYDFTEHFTARFETWCIHWFSQSNRPASDDETGVNIIGRYSF